MFSKFQFNFNYQTFFNSSRRSALSASDNAAFPFAFSESSAAIKELINCCDLDTIHAHFYLHSIPGVAIL
jgi:hypothetical protein